MSEKYSSPIEKLVKKHYSEMTDKELSDLWLRITLVASLFFGTFFTLSMYLIEQSECEAADSSWYFGTFLFTFIGFFIFTWPIFRNLFQKQTGRKIHNWWERFK